MKSNKTAKQLYKEYKIKFALVIALYVIALAILIFVMTKSMFIGILGIVVLAASIKMPFFKLEEELEAVIYEELDPEKFNELLDLGAFKGSNRHKVLGAVAAGEHDKALKLIKEYNPKRENPVETCNNIYHKGYVYFEKGEFDKLPEVIREYNRLKAKFPQLASVFNNYTVFDKFDAFADEDYEYVVEVCDIDLKTINPKKQNHKITRINVGFYRAASLYKLGKLDEARKGFEDIIDFAPKMHKAKLAKEYIDLIDKA
jgi:tetratricopeptide (TPR) repeat protein